jgi:hypothetical protein
MTFPKKKKSDDYVMTWDSDASSEDDDSSDDDKKSKKKALASIAINNKPSIFDTSSTYLMTKPTKVKYDESDDDDACESDDCKSDEDNDDDEEDSKEALMDMLENATYVLRLRERIAKNCEKRSKLSSDPLMSSMRLMRV